MPNLLNLPNAIFDHEECTVVDGKCTPHKKYYYVEVQCPNDLEMLNAQKAELLAKAAEIEAKIAEIEG